MFEKEINKSIYLHGIFRMSLTNRRRRKEDKGRREEDNKRKGEYEELDKRRLTH